MSGRSVPALNVTIQENCIDVGLAIAPLYIPRCWAPAATLGDFLMARGLARRQSERGSPRVFHLTLAVTADGRRGQGLWSLVRTARIDEHATRMPCGSASDEKKR